jgi:hypothetical protein
MGAPLPNFFVAGAGKAGTTSLHRYLAQHPDIFMSAIKEPSFFADEVRPGNLDPVFARRAAKVFENGAGARIPWIVSDWQDYLALFRDAAGRTAIGESTPTYLWSESAAANIHARIPGAKIVLILRDPAERAFSQYLHQVSEGLTDLSFREHIEAALRAPRGRLGALHPFLEVGLYCEQVKRYLALFPRESIRIYWYEQDWRDPRRLLRDLFQFLGVDPSFEADLTERAHVRRAPRFGALHRVLKRTQHRWSGVWSALPASFREGVRGAAFRDGASLTMDPRDRRFLVEYYARDIRNLSLLLNRDLASWLA